MKIIFVFPVLLASLFALTQTQTEEKVSTILPSAEPSVTDTLPEFPTSIVDFPTFSSLTSEVDEYRQSRLVDLSTFEKMASEPNTIILDTRSEKMYQQKHIKGAKHLNFSDFSESKLAQLISDKNTRILIYCNNNIANDPRSFALKSAPLALNIPTFINLYGYGYENLYELRSLVNVEDLEMEGTAVK